MYKELHIGMPQQKQVPLTYILGHEAIRNVDIKSAASVYGAVQDSDDSVATLITAFKMQIAGIFEGRIKAEDALTWCDSLAHCGANKLTSAEYKSLSREIEMLPLQLKSLSKAHSDIDRSGNYVVRTPAKTLKISDSKNDRNFVGHQAA